MDYLLTSVDEQPEPVETKVSGTIPDWLRGSFLGVGPGKYEVGEHKYNNFSDGLAILSRFNIQDGKISYNSRFLRSDTYVSNMENNRIMIDESGTTASPDPNKNVLQRFASHLTPTKKETSDNCNAIVWHCGKGEFYASKEGKFIRKFDPVSLETQQKVDLSSESYLKGMTLIGAHPHWDNDGTMYNIATSLDGGPKYVVFKVPSSEDVQNDECVFSRAEVMATIKGQFKVSPCYLHSFGMTENYIVFFEQPFYIDILKFLKQNVFGDPVFEAFVYDKSLTTKIHIIRKDTGEVVTTNKYVSPAVAVFHHINSYEDNDHIVLDFVDEIDPVALLHSANLEKLRNRQVREKLSEMKRMVIPLKIETDKKPAENLVTLQNTDATATLEKDGSVMCNIENINIKGLNAPNVNYNCVNGKDYKYIYGTGGLSKPSSNDFHNSLVKVNIQTKQTTIWRTEEDLFPNEPIFAAPSCDKGEDEGVLLATVNSTSANKSDHLIILDATSMKEMARAEVPKGTRVPVLFHATFQEVI